MTTDLRRKEIQVKEEFGTTPHRRYNSTSIFCDITTSGDWQEFHTTIPIEISLYAAATIIKETMEGDEAELLVGDEVQVAANAAPVAVDDDELTLSDVSYFRVGYWASITDGTNTDDLGRVLEIDEDASTIKVENAAVHAFAAGKAVKMQVKMGHSLKFAGAGAVNFGSAMIGGSLIPAGTKIRVRYKNNQGTAKKMMLMLEYRY